MRARRSGGPAWLVSLAVLSAVVALFLAGRTRHERVLLNAAESSYVRQLEAKVAARPEDAAAVGLLIRAYVDARQPGLAVALVDTVNSAVRDNLHVQHAYARALLDDGRNNAALATEKCVVAACLSPSEPTHPECDPTLLASAVRRADILRELVALGVQDAAAHPQETLVAYRNATREARVVAQ